MIALFYQVAAIALVAVLVTAPAKAGEITLLCANGYSIESYDQMIPTVTLLCKLKNSSDTGIKTIRYTSSLMMPGQTEPWSDISTNYVFKDEIPAGHARNVDLWGGGRSEFVPRQSKTVVTLDDAMDEDGRSISSTLKTGVATFKDYFSQPD